MAEKNSGAKIFIGGNSATLAAEATWHEIIDVKGITGSLGMKWKTVDVSDLSDVVDLAAKTTVDAGALTIVYNDKAADAGQVALKAAAADGDSDLPYNFKILNSAGTRNILFKAHVLSDVLGGFDRGNVRQRTAEVKLQTLPTDAAVA